MGLQENGQFLVLRGVTKTFKSSYGNPFKPRGEVRALDKVNLEIPQGRITCLLGPNGAGKTTLIKILADLITPDSGEVLFGGINADRLKKSARPRMGMVTPNERSFYWRLSGRENLFFFGRLFGYSSKELKRRVAEALGEVGMEETADTPYRLYSAGMKQKINIARALLGEPELYLLDEPASHLDPVAREEFRLLIKETLVGRRGATIFLCTHDLEEARKLGDRLVVLNAGKVVREGEWEDVSAGCSARRELTLSYSGQVPEGWPELPGVEAAQVRKGILRLSFEPERTAQDAILSSFIMAGGRLLEAYRSEDELLEFIRKAMRKDE